MQCSPYLFCILCSLTFVTTSSTAGDTPTSPKLLWQYSTGQQPPLSIEKDPTGPYLYAALQTGGLAILDLSDPAAPPKRVATIANNRFQSLDVMHLAQKGNLLYLALGNFFNAQKGSLAGLAIVDVRNRRTPKVLSVTTVPKSTQGSAFVLVSGSYAYLAAMESGVFIFDISEPSQPRQIGGIQPDIHFPRKNPNQIQHPNARGLALRDNWLFVAYDAGGLRVLDVSDTSKPKEVGRYANPVMFKKQQAYNNVVLHGNYAYLPVDYAGLEIVDVRNPRNIRQVGWWNPWRADTLANLWFNSPGHTNQIVLDSKKGLAYLSAGDSELQIVNITDPKRPRLVGSYGHPKNKLGAWGLTLSDDRIYLSYIQAFVPFRSTWAGIRALKR